MAKIYVVDEVASSGEPTVVADKDSITVQDIMQAVKKLGIKSFTVEDDSGIPLEPGDFPVVADVYIVEYNVACASKSVYALVEEVMDRLYNAHVSSQVIDLLKQIPEEHARALNSDVPDKYKRAYFLPVQEYVKRVIYKGKVYDADDFTTRPYVEAIFFIHAGDPSRSVFVVTSTGHPNVEPIIDEDCACGYLCLGDMEKLPHDELLKRVESAVLTVNLDSAYNEEYGVDITDEMLDELNDDDFEPIGELWSVHDD